MHNILKKNNSKIKIEQNKIFDDYDDFDKILSKPMIIDSKIKDINDKPFDFFKKKDDSIKDRSIKINYNNYRMSNSNSNGELFKEITKLDNSELSEKSNPKKYNDAIIFINSRIKNYNTYVKEENINNLINDTSINSNNLDFSFSFHKSENVSLNNENNSINIDKSHDFSGTDQITPYISHNNSKSSNDIAKNNFVLKEKIYDIIYNNITPDCDLIDPHTNILNRLNRFSSQTHEDSL